MILTCNLWILPHNSSVRLDFSCLLTYVIISGLHKQLLLHFRWPFSSHMDCNFMFRCRSYFPISNRSLEEVLKLNSLFVMDLSCWRVSNFSCLIANTPREIHLPYERHYIFYSISKDHFFVFKEVFSENSVLMYGLYSRAAYGGACTVCTW